MKNIFIILALVFCSLQVRGQIFLSEIQDTVGKGYVPITDYDPALATYIQKYMLLQDYLEDSISWASVPVGLHDAVTLAGSYDYITLSGQVITRNQIDLTTDVTGLLPYASLSGAPTLLSQFTDDLGHLEESTTVTDLANGLDISLSTYDITVSPDFVELTTETTIDGTDYIIIHDATTPNDGKITYANLLADIVSDASLDLYQVLTNGNDAGGLDAINFAEVEADEFIGDLRGAVLFKAQAGETLAKGDVVYVSGISGNTTIVSKADADDSAKMPAFGVVAAAASSPNPVDIYTFGTLSNLNTSGYTLGDILYVSTTAGQLTATPPTGESALIQNIAKVTRVDNSAGSIKISGAGRTNATPNLNTGRLFVGNASNQAVADGTIYVDIANSRVGIGTSSPAAPLHIVGKTNLQGTTNTSHFNYPHGGGVESTYIRSGTNSGTVYIQDNNRGDVSINGANGLYYQQSTYRIGIGTTSPLYQFHQYSASGGTRTVFESGGGSGASSYSTTHAELVVDSGEGNMGIQLMGTTTSNQRILFGDTGANARGWLEYEHDILTGEGMKFGVVGSTAMVIDDNQNVGIGLVNPDEILEVTNDEPIIKISSADQIEATGGTEVIGGIEFEGNKNAIFSPSGKILSRQSGNTWSSATQYNAPSDLEFYAQNNTSTDYTDHTTAVPIMTLHGISQSVGIATREPSATLDVNGDVEITTVPTENTDNILTYGSTGLVSKTTKADIIADAGYWDRSGGILTQANLDDQVHIDGSGTELLVTGGHGSSVPIADFRRDDVVDDRVYISANASEPQVSFVQGDGVNANEFSIGVGYEGSFEVADNTYLGTNTRFVIDNTGNVGIGINPASRKLTVKDDSDWRVAYFESTYLSGTNRYSSIVVGSAQSSGQSAQFGFIDNTLDRNLSYAHITPYGAGEGNSFRVYRNGNIVLNPVVGFTGIGTSSPSSKLTVDENTNVGLEVFGGNVGRDIARFHRDIGVNTTVGINGNGSAAQMYFENPLGGYYSIGNDINGDFQIANSQHIGTNVRFHIEATTGNVGIGTSSPSAKIHVESLTSVGQYINYDGTSNSEYGLRIESNANGGNFESDFTNGTTALLDLYANSSVVSGGDLFVARTQNATPLFLIKGTGNVGIGTQSPSKQLTIQSNGNAESLIETTIDALAATTLKNADAQWRIGVEPFDDGLIFRQQDAGYTVGEALKLETDLDVRVYNNLTVDGIANVTGNITSYADITGDDFFVRQGIVAEGDTDTEIDMNLNDEIEFYAGGRKMFRIDEDAQDVIEFNPNAQNIDFLIDSDNVSEIFKVDASADEVQINGEVTWSERALGEMYRLAEQSVTNGNTDKIDFSTQVYQDGDITTDVTTNERITVTNAGKYTIHLSALMSNDGTSSDSGRLLIYKNGSQIADSEFSNVQHVGLASVTKSISGILNLAASDYLEVYLQELSGTGDAEVARVRFTVKREIGY